MSDENPTPKSVWSLFAEPEKPESAPSPFWKLFGTDEPPPEEQLPSGPEFDVNSVFWAMRNLPVNEAVKHFLICGATGSGKSLSIQLLLKSIADRFLPRPEEPTTKSEPNATGKSPPDPKDLGEQLILFDAKCDALPMLAALGLHKPHDNFWILNPFDRRSAEWRFSEAVTNPGMARALATLLIPEERGSNAPFFADAARELVYAVLQSLNKVAGSDWDFRDLLCALDSRENIEGITAQHAPAERLAKRILDDERHSNGVLSTMASKLGRFEQVAALWHSLPDNTPRFSVKEFLKKPGVLVLGNDPVLRDSFWPINAILLKALANEILRGPEVNYPRFWFVLDEFRAMEKIDCIHDLLNRGRSKGVSVLLGIQTYEGLAQVYGDNGANDILSQCGFKTFLRAGGPRTAEWAEQFFNKVRRIEETHSESTGTEGSSKSKQYSLQERSMILASNFLELPFPVPGGAFAAVCDVPYLGETLIVQRSADQVIKWANDPPPDKDVPAVDPREEPEDQTLSPWVEKDERKFLKKSPANDTNNQIKPEPSNEQIKLPERHDVDL